MSEHDESTVVPAGATGDAGRVWAEQMIEQARQDGGEFGGSGWAAG